MRPSNETLSYLRGEQYTNALTVTFEFDKNDYEYETQADLLCKLATKKRIIHVGCVDHTTETITHKNKRKKWLHSRLCQNAQRCHGIDIQEDGIRFIREELGYNDTSCITIMSEEFRQLAASDSWDYLFIPEVLEHVDDPIGFLSNIRKHHMNDFTKIVVTVPNALCQDNLKLARKGHEIINSDHRFWFTPYTLAKCSVIAGYTIEELRMCRHGTINWRAIRRNRFFKKHPLLRNDIVCILRCS